MNFEIGKYYKHTSGEKMAIIGKVVSTMYGECLVGETVGGTEFKPVGMDYNADNWHEITKAEWLASFR